MENEAEPLDGVDESETVPTEELEELEGEEGAEIASPPTVEEYARAKGWKPKEEWDGEGEHRTAAEFLDFGLDRAKDVSRDLKDLRKTTETMAETQARIVRDQVERARNEERQKWQNIHKQAVDDGDQELAQRAVDNITNVAQSQPDASVTDWVSANPWFHSDPAAKAVAVAVSGQNQHLSTAEQLAKATEAVHKRFPEYAPKTEAPTKAVQVATPAATARPVKRGKTFADLPPAAQEAARAMVNQGLLANTDGYVKQYFNKEGTVE